MNFDKLVEELRNLKYIEKYERDLTTAEEIRYNELVTFLENNNVDIPFDVIK